MRIRALVLVGLIPIALEGQSLDTTSAPLLRPGVRGSGEWLQNQRPEKTGFRNSKHLYAGHRDELVTFTLSAAFGATLSVQTIVRGRIVQLAKTDSVKPVSTIEMKLPVEGRYLVVASARSAGTYTLSARSSGSVSAINWATVYPGGGNPDESYALLVGVNDYPGTKNDLSGGPLVDVELMRAVLIEKLGINPKNILVLRDEEGNREQLVEAFRRHLGQAGPRGAALFYYSGHGMQLTRRGGSDREDDNRDEVLSLWGTEDELYGYLLDDELGVLIDELKTDRVTIILDDCNAGTATRGGERLMWSEISGGIRPPPVLLRQRRRPGIPVVQLKRINENDIAAELENPALALKPKPGQKKKDHVLLAASDDAEQTASIEMQLDDGTSVQVGLFTILMFQTLMASDGNVTFESLVKTLRPKVMATALKVAGRPQTIQLSGSRTNTPMRSFLRPSNQ